MSSIGSLAASLGSLYELLDNNGQRLPRLEASGIAYSDGRLFVVDDTLNALFVFNVEGRLLGYIEPSRFPRARAKFEDLAYGEDDRSFFVVGSHFGWDDDAFIDQSVLLRFRLREGDGLAVEESSVETLRLSRSFARLGLWEPRKMNIEGLAYDPERRDLYVGLRQPSDRARAYRLSATALENAGADEEAPLPEEVVSFDAGTIEGTPFCLSALLWLRQPAGLLIATSTEDETHRFLGNRLWFAPVEGGVKLLLDTFDAGMKAEGLAVGEGKLFISYDNDQDDTGIPSHVRVLPLEDLFEHFSLSAP